LLAAVAAGLSATPFRVTPDWKRSRSGSTVGRETIGCEDDRRRINSEGWEHDATGKSLPTSR